VVGNGFERQAPEDEFLEVDVREHAAALRIGGGGVRWSG
jgi:hypothetical protein